MSARLVIDLETSGLWKDDLDVKDPSQPWPCQIGAALFTPAWECVGKFERLVKPDGWSIQPEARAVHGITDEQCHWYGARLALLLADLQDMAEQAKEIVGFNFLAFDRNLITAAIARVNGSGVWWQKKFHSMVDVMIPLTDRLRLPGQYGNKQPSLKEAVGYFRPTANYVPRHRALEDVMATAMVAADMEKAGWWPT